MATTGDLKRNLVIQIDNAPCLVLDVTTQTPSARGGSTLIKTKYRNLLTGQVLEKAFKSGERVEDADFETSQRSVPVCRRRAWRVHRILKITNNTRSAGICMRMFRVI